MSSSISLLEKLETMVDVDVDSLSPKVATSMPIKLHDQTSNNLWVSEEIKVPEKREMLLNAVKEYKELGWEKTLDRMTALMCAANIGNISGRVLAQTSPRFAYDTEKTIAHARSYAEEFEKVGISKDRFCIKIPATGPSLQASPILLKEGIRTLGTAVFSLAQAIACSQAKCLYISPYYNEVRAHVDVKLWPDVKDPIAEHPMSARIIQMLEAYRELYKKTGEEQPWMKLASFLSIKESMAAAEMGCHSATISAQVLKELASTTYSASSWADLPASPKPAHPYLNAGPTPSKLVKLSKTDPLAAADWDGKLASLETDYLANNGEELEKAIEKDPITKFRLTDALEMFEGGEKESRGNIEKALKEVGL